MYQVIIVIHVLLGLGVVGLVLMQQGKGADAGAAFGTGSSGSVFGAQGAASFLSRTTAILAALFFTTSLGLAIMNSQQSVAKDLIINQNAQQDVPSAASNPVSAEIPVVPSATNADEQTK
jgi:preprotein translocase subunit SecG